MIFMRYSSQIQQLLQCLQPAWTVLFTQNDIGCDQDPGPHLSVCCTEPSFVRSRCRTARRLPRWAA